VVAEGADCSRPLSLLRLTSLRELEDHPPLNLPRHSHPSTPIVAVLGQPRKSKVKMLVLFPLKQSLSSALTVPLKLLVVEELRLPPHLDQMEVSLLESSSESCWPSLLLLQSGTSLCTKRNNPRLLQVVSMSKQGLLVNIQDYMMMGNICFPFFSFFFSSSSSSSSFFFFHSLSLSLLFFFFFFFFSFFLLLF